MADNRATTRHYTALPPRVRKEYIPSTPEQQPPPELLDTIIGLKAGRDDKLKSFFVHKGLVTYYSGYFRAAFRGGFTEAARGVVNLTHEDPNTVAAFVSWIYFRRLPEPTPVSGVFARICKLWIFADAHDVPMLANAMINAMRDEVFTTWTLPFSVLDYIFEHTLEAAALRRLVVMLIVKTSRTSTLTRVKTEYGWSMPVRQALMQSALMRDASHETKLLSRGALGYHDLCDFHNHDDGFFCLPKRKFPAWMTT